MMETSTISYEVKPLSIMRYAADLAKTGKYVLFGERGTIWVRYEKFAMMRMPTFYMEPPNPEEVRRVLLRGWSMCSSFIVMPDESHPANAWLYICTDQKYELNKLIPAMRRNVRRGLKELKIGPLSSDEVLFHGVQAYCDTRRRIGLSDGTPEAYKKRFIKWSKCPGHTFLGAWRNEKLIAFLSIIVVEDWAEIEGCFSMNDFLIFRPNDTLIYSALHYYLIEEKYRAVNYGLSSIQIESNEEGLHAFKTKVGFDAIPVHRVFILHPLIRPFIRLMPIVFKLGLRFKPNSRILKKVDGAFSVMFNKKKIS